MHLTFQEAMTLAQKIGAQQTYFTHIGHETEHHAINDRLPKGYALAYDGLQISFKL